MQGQGRNRRLSRSDELQSPRAGCLAGQVGKPVPRRRRGTSLKTCPGRDTGRQVRPNPAEVPIPALLQSPRAGSLPGQVGKPVPRRGRGTSLKTCPGRETGRQIRPNPAEVPIPALLQSPRAGCLPGQVGKPVPRRRRGTSLKTCPGRDTGRQVRPNPDEVPIPTPLQSPTVGFLPGQVGKPVPRWSLSDFATGVLPHCPPPPRLFCRAGDVETLFPLVLGGGSEGWEGTGFLTAVPPGTDLAAMEDV
jgi:hypothetical protein